MKNFILIIALGFSIITNSTGQIDISTTPVSALTKGLFTLGVEKGISEHITFEAMIMLTSPSWFLESPYKQASESQNTLGRWLEGAGYFGNLKYYVTQSENYDKFYVGVYAKDLGKRYDEGFGAGWNYGYKYVNRSGFLIDLSMGIGVKGNEDYPADEGNKLSLDSFVLVAVGYRI